MRRIALGLATSDERESLAEFRAEGRYFLSVGGAGPDGAIVNGVSQISRRDPESSHTGMKGCANFFSTDFPEMRVSSNGKSAARRLWWWDAPRITAVRSKSPPARACSRIRSNF